MNTSLFILLFALCTAVIVLIACRLKRSCNPQEHIAESFEDADAEYYTPDGYHVYYDRKILRRLREEERKRDGTTSES